VKKKSIAITLIITIVALAGLYSVSASEGQPSEPDLVLAPVIESQTTKVFLPLILAQAGCNPGSTILDPTWDVSLAHIDVTALSTTLTGQTLQATFQIRDVPSNLTFYRIGVPANRVEYSWDVWVDTDNDSQTGCEFSIGLGAEYVLSARHIIWTPNSPITQPIENGVESHKWECDGMGIRELEPIFLSVDATSDTMILTGDIPGITTGSRIFFTTYDYNPNGYSIHDLSSCAN